jgi:phosphatidylglycerol:prolipoprotein diacylglycerol transferase
MFTNNFDPVAIQILSLDIRWYSLAYIVGILAGWILSKRIFITDKNLKENFDDYISYVILGIIVGGRLGYVFFYNYNYYSNNLIDLFKIWQGGMSFHGGLTGVIIVTILFSKSNNQNAFIYLDIVSLVAPIGLFFGRIANFINGALLVNFILKTISSLFDFKIVINSVARSFEDIKPCSKSFAILSITNFEFFIYLYNNLF